MSDSNQDSKKLNKEEKEKQREINEAVDDSFPASDPPAWNASPKEQQKKVEDKN